MPGPMTVTCPHCGAGLKLKNDSFVGKRVPCPKCREPFKVEAPEDDLSDNFDDDYGAMEEEVADEEVEERPKSKKGGASASGKAKGGKGKKKSKGGGNGGRIALMVGGALLGIGLLGGLVYGAISLIGRSGGADSWVQWLPEETDIAIRVRVADIAKAPVFAPFTNDPVLKPVMDDPTILVDEQMGAADPMAPLKSLNLKPGDFESVTIGFINAMTTTPPNNPGVGGFMSDLNPLPKSGNGIGHNKQFVGVLKLTRSIDSTIFSQMPPEVMVKEDYSGKTLYSMVGINNPKLLIYPVDGQTIVFGSEVELKAAVDGNGKAPAHSRFKFANDSASILLVAAPKELNKLRGAGLKQMEMLNGVPTGKESEITEMYGQSFSITFGSDISYEQTMSCSQSMASNTVASYKEAIGKIQAESQAGKEDLKGNLFGGNPLIPSDRADAIIGHLQTMISSLSVEAKGEKLTVSTKLSGQLFVDLRQAINPMMPMASAYIEAAAKKKAATKPANTMGNSAADVLNYPSTVINAGHSAQTRVEDSAAQHNANIEAAMNEGGSPAAAHGATADPNAVMKAAAEAQQTAPAAAPAGHEAHGAPADPNAVIKAAAAQQNGNPAPAAGHEAHAAPNAGVDPAAGNMAKEPAAGGPAASHGAAANGAAGAGEGAATGDAAKPEPPKSRRRR